MHIKLTQENLSEAIRNASEVLKKGGIIVYPTDTAYGLGVDAQNVSALKRLYTLKNRVSTKPFPIIVSNISMAKAYAHVDARALQLSKAFLPGPLTLIMQKSANLPDELTSNQQTVGVRIPANDFCLGLAESFQRPFTATSANVSTQATCYSISAVKSQFAKENMLDYLDLIVDAGELPTILPSTILDLTQDIWKILRPGPITEEQIKKVIQ